MKALRDLESQPTLKFLYRNQTDGKCVAIRTRTLLHASVWIAAIIVGISAVLYAKVIAWTQRVYLDCFQSQPFLLSIVTPVGFLFASFLVRKFAPEAKGSGIPQVLQAIELSKESSCAKGKATNKDIWQTELVSLRTAFFKVLSSMVGILAGASIGREGPTVQIASSGFAWIGRKVKGHLPQVDFQSYLIAGAAAGVAAAFNTPLAGITFALEEIADGAFGPFRQNVMMAVIIAGITAQALMGDYLYFGHPILPKSNFMVIPEALLIGILGGLLGGAFAKVLAFPKLTRLPEHWLTRAFICGAICAAITLLTHGDSAGSGYEITRKTLESSDLSDANLYFPILKLVTTVLSYLSGMAGGIFSPCLSIGAGLGTSIAKLAHFANFKACALMGMVAFFSGVVQAPLTAVIIVTEMTDEHILIIPFMIAAFLAQAIGKWLMPVPLYGFLAGRHEEG